ncbi:pentapeptide repeat-containing protein [uncultured Prevotella sp.]|uniref:pentapeptide repeat-containing protein n=1 Tax=uncultured Prevotella sp. TaxID=159272 RepID=UPI00345BE263
MKEKVHFLLSFAISPRLRALSSNFSAANFSAANFSAANFSAASLRSVALSDKRVEYPNSLN